MLYNKITINIAGINFNLTFDENPALPKNLNKFIKKKSSKHGCNYLVLKNNLKNLTESKPYIKIFQSEGWVLSKNINNKIQLAVYSNEKLTRLAILRNNYLQGKIFLIAQHKDIRLFYAYDYPIDQILFSVVASKYQALLFHAFGLALNKNGILFLGRSGAGKSTSANLWAKYSKEVVLSDDRVAVRKAKNKLILHGTPWHGDANMYSNKSAPLKKIFFLKHGKKNEIKLINSTQAAALLIARSFPPYWDAEGTQNVLNLCTEIAQTISCYEFSFVPDKSAVDFVSNLD